MCFQIKSDLFDEDIHIHELAHGIHLVGGPIIKGYSNALLKSYKWAMSAGTGLCGQANGFEMVAHASVEAPKRTLEWRICEC